MTKTLTSEAIYSYKPFTCDVKSFRSFKWTMLKLIPHYKWDFLLYKLFILSST